MYFTHSELDWRDRDLKMGMLLATYKADIERGIEDRSGWEAGSISVARSRNNKNFAAVFYKGLFLGSISRMQVLYCALLSAKTPHEG